MKETGLEAYISGIMLKNLRKERGYTIEEVANQTMLSIEEIQQLEQGDTTIPVNSLLTLYKIDEKDYANWRQCNHDLLSPIEDILLTLKEYTYIQQYNLAHETVRHMKYLQLPFEYNEALDAITETATILQNLHTFSQKDIKRFLIAMIYLHECFEEREIFKTKENI